MPDLHAALAWVAAAATVVLLAVAIATAAGRLPSYRALDRALLAQLAMPALAGLTGGAALAASGPPADPLHLLYGAVAALAPGAARAAAHGGGAARLARWVAVGSLVAVGATVRSFMTGS